MNANDLKKLKEWREYIEEGLTPTLWDIPANLAEALHDILKALGVGDADIEEILGPENWERYQASVGSREIEPMDEPTRAYRLAKATFDPGDMGRFGLKRIYGIEMFPGFWEAAEENVDGRFFMAGPLLFDQNERAIYSHNGDIKPRDLLLEAYQRASLVLGEQITYAWEKMKEAQDDTIP